MLTATACSTAIPSAELNGHASYSYEEFLGTMKGTMEVTNDDTFDWNEATMTLNDVYKYSMSLFKSGDTAEISLSDYVKSDGTRFDIQKTKPLRLQVKSREGSTQWVWK